MCHQTPLVELVPAGGRHDGCSPGCRPRAPRRSSSRSSSPRASPGGSATRFRDGWIASLSDEAGDPVQRPRPRRSRRAGLRLPGPAAARGHRVLRPDRPHRSGRVSSPRRLRGPAALPRAALARRRSSSRSTASGPAGPRRGRLSHRAEVGRGPQRPPARRNMSSATATKATPAPSWTACCWNRFPIASSRAWRSPPGPWGPTKASSTSAPNIRWRSSGSTRPCEQCRQRGLLGDRVLGTDFRLHLAVKEGGGGLRLRRGDGPAGLPGRPPRHAPAASALPGRVAACGASRPPSTTSKPTPWSPGSSATAPRPSPSWAPTRARAPRSSPWPARSAAAA